MRDAPKYSLSERERRWLVRSDWRADHDRPFTLIEDRYLQGSHLRLRKTITRPGGAVVYKVGKKYPSVDPAERSITNIYLDADEYQRFLLWQGHDLIKRRYQVVVGETRYGVDVFAGALQGLTLCEADADSSAQLAAFDAPPFALREVTAIAEFNGFHLAQLTATALQLLLARYRGTSTGIA